MWAAYAATVFAFLLVGIGLHTTQTAGLALATDVVSKPHRSQVVALLYVMLLLGMVISSWVFAQLLSDFSAVRLIQVLQGAAVVTLLLNVIALWKQEVRQQVLTRHDRQRPSLSQSWKRYLDNDRTGRFLLALALGTAAFSMQDILLEPYGAQVFTLNVGQTTALTAFFSVGMMAGFFIAARQLGRGNDPYRLSAYGVTLGAFSFGAVMFAAPLSAVVLFRFGVVLIGLGTGIFSVAMLSAAMARASELSAGLALGAWGAIQATAVGSAIFIGGLLRDLVSSYAQQGLLGSTLNDVSTGYIAVFVTEILLLFATLIVLGPLVGTLNNDRSVDNQNEFGLAAFPG
jgi:BCD family chlorophyll transporter-like MFS transporter